MLRGLDIRDILIIDRLELEFQPGLNVLTGETGAGKSILLDSLGFVLGWRGRADLVRSGAARGEVTAWFELPDGHSARQVLAEAGLPDSEELVLRRTNTNDGRKTAYVNDRRVSGDVLRRLSECLVELHGQHDDRGLLDPRGHGALLDAFAGHEGRLAALRDAWRALSAARKAEATTRDQLEAARAEEDFLRHAVAELDALDPQPSEEAELDTKRRTMQAAERVRTDVQQAGQVLGGDGAEAHLANALRWLEGASDQVGNLLDAPLAALDRAMTELSDAQSGVEQCLQALDFDPLDLEATEERLFALRALARKHDVLPSDLAGLAANLRARLAGLDRGEQELSSLAAERLAAQADFDAQADELSAARKAAGSRLDAAMAAELAPLKMERAVFSTEIVPSTAGPLGADAVSFRVATNPGAPSGPLDKIASGGELSRFLLALKVCLTADTTGVTLIFDEIDRGVGGATANAVGRRLAALAGENGGQVLVVTHSPQVAALGAHHWRVEKSVVEGVTFSRVVPLSPDERIDEIARMLSGDQVTSAAREAARALLNV